MVFSHEELNFDQLVDVIRGTHKNLSNYACRAINISLTVRNWLIGCYIAEYELNGVDRAVYGEKVFSALASRLKDISNCNRRQLYRYLRFYRVYPQIVGTVPPQFLALDPKSISLPIVGTASPQLEGQKGSIIESLSYSHFELLAEMEDETKRAFYQIESIIGSWSVRELKRQIGSLYYERSSLSVDKHAMSELANRNSQVDSSHLTIRDPYVFEFLDLKPIDVMSESHLEGKLIEKLESFLLELGHGFCFEARQKRILIGDEHFFVDLVFYHRILKCHILVELKLEAFSHQNVGQLNTYVSWYKKNMMSEGDNPPIGILLCADKNHTLAEYALAGMDNSLFISKYQLELPKTEEIQAFIDSQVSYMNELS